jgi:hypothetical protein
MYFFFFIPVTKKSKTEITFYSPLSYTNYLALISRAPQMDPFLVVVVEIYQCFDFTGYDFHSNFFL